MFIIRSLPKSAQKFSPIIQAHHSKRDSMLIKMADAVFTNLSILLNNERMQKIMLWSTTINEPDGYVIALFDGAE